MSEQTSQGGSGSDRWWLAAAVVVVLVLAGLVWVILDGRDPSSGASSTPSSAAASSTAPPTSAIPTASGTTWPGVGCNGTAGQVVAPQAAMTDVTWQPYPALPAAAPVSPTIGPKVTDPLRRCYQHTPAGALLAAVNIEFGLASAKNRQVAEEQVTAGPGRTEILDSLSSMTGSVGNVAAFRLAGCTSQVCNVELIYLGGGSYADGLIPMTWTGQDWKIDGSSKMQEPGLVVGIPAGFTAWGASS